MLFTALLGLMALIYCIQDLLNLHASYGTFDLIMGQSANKAFAVSLFPSLGPPLTRIAAWITFIAEAATGVALLFGAWKMWAARAADRSAFAASTHYARLGAGLAVFTWFGLFGVGGGAAWQMWQHTVGSGALENAFQFSVWGFLLLIWLSQGEREAG
ncbi:MAG: DUF2165 family protein [Porphyrobacter sp.]|nr:DUF2165 family protein [Porphyrobacter sp.]